MENQGIERILNFICSVLKFIGCINTQMEIPVEDQPILEKLLNAYGCYPLYIPQEDFKKYYYGFCKRILWPLLHDVVDLYIVYEPFPLLDIVRMKLLCGIINN